MEGKSIAIVVLSIAVIVLIFLTITFASLYFTAKSTERFRTPWKKGPERLGNPFDQLTPAQRAIYNNKLRKDPVASEYFNNKQEPPALVQALFS